MQGVARGSTTAITRGFPGAARASPIFRNLSYSRHQIDRGTLVAGLNLPPCAMGDKARIEHDGALRLSSDIRAAVSSYGRRRPSRAASVKMSVHGKTPNAPIFHQGAGYGRPDTTWSRCQGKRNQRSRWHFSKFGIDASAWSHCRWSRDTSPAQGRLRSWEAMSPFRWGEGGLELLRGAKTYRSRPIQAASTIQCAHAGLRYESSAIKTPSVNRRIRHWPLAGGQPWPLTPTLRVLAAGCSQRHRLLRFALH